jgi:hypothetical protein
VQNFPDTPPLSEETRFTGHLWIQELITGEPLRFEVLPSGLVRFGDEVRVFDADEEPLKYHRAAEHVRDNIDLEVLREALDDTGSVVFFGTATLYEGIGYDWSELPPFLGVDIWSDEKGTYLPPDASTRAYGSIGLSGLPAVEKEADARYTDVQGYRSGDLPESEFHKGPAAGVLVRDKSGVRAKVRRAVNDDESPGADDKKPDEIAEIYVTDAEIDETAELLGGENGATVEAVIERTLADTVRENYSALYRGGEPVVPEKRLRTEVAERIRRRLA